MLEPGVQLAGSDALQHAAQAFQEGGHRFGCGAQQRLAQVQDVSLRTLGYPVQRLGAVGQEGGGIPQPCLGQPLAQPEEAAGLSFVDLLQHSGRQLQAGLDLPPATVGQGAGHGQEGFPLPPHGWKDVPAQDQAFHRHIVGLVGQSLNEGGEDLHIPEGEVAD